MQAIWNGVVIAESDDTVIVERFVSGLEVNVGILNGRALGAIEISPKNGIYDYEAKYKRTDTKYLLPPELPDDIVARCAGNPLFLIETLRHTAPGGTGVPGAVFGLAFQTSNFASMLSFLQTQGTLQVLSSPRIAALNNQKAVLKVGDQAVAVVLQHLGEHGDGGHAGEGVDFVQQQLAGFFFQKEIHAAKPCAVNRLECLNCQLLNFSRLRFA